MEFKNNYEGLKKWINLYGTNGINCYDKELGIELDFSLYVLEELNILKVKFINDYNSCEIIIDGTPKITYILELI